MSTILTKPHTKWPVAAAIGVAGTIAVLILVLAFLWPTKTTSVHNLPVSVSGNSAAVQALEAAVAEKSPGTFDFVAAADRAESVAQIESREVYGAIVLGEGATALPEVLTAPAGGAAPVQILTGIAAQLQAQVAQKVAAAGGNPATAVVAVTPVVPLAASDAAGTGLVAASFPLTMGGMIGGILISLLVVGAIRRLVALAGFGIVGGIALAFVMQTWFEFLQGDFWINATAMGLSILATASFIVGCTSLLGTRGIGIGAVLTMLIGNPISAAAAPWQFLPEPFGAMGQYFVPGASNWLIRSLSYFPSTDLTQQWWTLLAWTGVGLALTVTGHFRAKATMHVPESTLDSPTREPAIA